jgi:hypothetical protein
LPGDLFADAAVSRTSPSSVRTLRHVDLERATAPRARPRQWREILADALAGHEAISVRGTVIDHLRRTPTRAEITAERRAAHRLAASGQATVLHIRPPGFDGPGSPQLVLARPGTARPSASLDEIAEQSLANTTRQRFEPIAMAQDLATSVELLSAAIEAIPADRLNRAEGEELVASLDASFDVLQRIRRHLRQMSGGRSNSLRAASR